VVCCRREAVWPVLWAVVGRMFVMAVCLCRNSLLRLALAWRLSHLLDFVATSVLFITTTSIEYHNRVGRHHQCEHLVALAYTGSTSCCSRHDFKRNSIPAVRCVATILASGSSDRYPPAIRPIAVSHMTMLTAVRAGCLEYSDHIATECGRLHV